MTIPNLRRVDSLDITFLVDNSIEWLGKFPPGFKKEINTHLEHPSDAVVDPMTGVPTLNFDNFCCEVLQGAHGFSVLIETQITGEQTHSTLFDTGPDSLSLVRNIRAMHVSVADIDRVILSHWHADHSGGLIAFLEQRQRDSESTTTSAIATGQAESYITPDPCIIDLHPDRPTFRGIAPPPYDKVLCSLPADPTFEQIREAGGSVDKHAEGHAVADGTVWVSGLIPRVTDFEEGLMGGMRWVDDKWVKEQDILDERYAVIDVAGKGLVILSACSHAGIVNVVKDVVNTFQRPIHMIIGGLHLATPDLAYRIKPTVDFFFTQLKPSPSYILPMHCTGFGAKLALERVLGTGCVPAGVGLSLNVSSDRQLDERLFPPSF